MQYGHASFTPYPTHYVQPSAPTGGWPSWHGWPHGGYNYCPCCGRPWAWKSYEVTCGESADTFRVHVQDQPQYDYVCDMGAGTHRIVKTSDTPEGPFCEEVPNTSLDGGHLWCLTPDGWKPADQTPPETTIYATSYSH